MLYLYISDESLRDEARDLVAITKGVHIITELPQNTNIYLQFDQSGLAIVSYEFKLTYVNELYNKLLLRLKTLNQELLIQTLKIKGVDKPLIWDITAGLGRDAILMANAGHKVTMIERNPALAIILNYIIKNKIFPGTENLNLAHMNSMDYLLQNHSELPHVIYMDPMFQDNARAKSKKDMQIIEMLLHVTSAGELLDNNCKGLHILSDDINRNKQRNLSTSSVIESDENINLFALAYKTVLNKVIVKRDNKQQNIVGLPLVSYNKCGKTVRYDVYLKS